MFKKALMTLFALSQLGICLPDARGHAIDDLRAGQKCPTITSTVTVGKKTKTLTQPATTTTTTITTTVTSTPGPIVELIGYDQLLCGVPPVLAAGNTPNFQLVDLTPKRCVNLGAEALSVSYHVVPGLAAASSCQVYVYGDYGCDSGVSGAQQLSLAQQNKCQDVVAKSVLLYC